MDNLTIGRLAEMTAVQPRTIRFYEGKGLLPPPRRSDSGYRLYTAQDVKRLSHIRTFRALGFTLREIRDVMAVAQHVDCASFQGKVAKRIVNKLDEVDAAITQWTKMRSDLNTALGTLMTNAGGCDSGVLECEDCRCLGSREVIPPEGRK